MSAQSQGASSYEFLRKQAAGYRVGLLILAIAAMFLAAVNYQMLDESFVRTNFQMAIIILALTAAFGFICLGAMKGYLKVRRSASNALRAGTVTEMSDVPVRASKKKGK